jgi:hypothetical protein
MSGQTQAAAPTPNDGDVIPLSMTTGGRMRTDVSGTVAVSGTVTTNATIVGTPAVTVSGTPNVNATISGTPTVNSTGTPTNGSIYNYTTTASTNGANIKNSAGSLFELTAYNSTAGTIYIRFYNKASSPSVGSDIPIMTIPVATNSFGNAQFGHLGKRFPLGISISITGAGTNTDATNTAAGALISATYL